MKRRWSGAVARLVVLGCLLFGASATVAQNATPVASTQGLTLVASGLENPRGFAWGADGTLYVAQADVNAGDAGEQATPVASGESYSGGLNGSVVRITDGCPVVYQGNLPSADGAGGPNLGPSDLAFLDGQLYVLDEGGGASHGNPLTPDGIYAIDGGGSARLIADIGAWIQENPVTAIPEDYDPDGDPFGMVASGGALWVVERNSGQLLKVTPDGTIDRIADFSTDDHRPTGIAVGPDGRMYLGFMTPPPYGDGESMVITITSIGMVVDAWLGLTAVVDVAVGQDGTVYALQMGTGAGDDPWSFEPNTGKVVRQTGADSSADVAVGFNVPGAMEVGPDQGLYVSSPAFGGDAATGSIVRIDTNQGQLMAMSNSLLAGSPCVSAPTPASTPAPVGSPTASPGTPAAGSPAPASGVSVTIENYAFSPATLSVSPGTTVTWTNNDTTAHTVSSTDGTFDSGNLAPGDSFSYTFPGAGTYGYQCSYHPNMTAEIDVQ